MGMVRGVLTLFSYNTSASRKRISPVMVAGLLVPSVLCLMAVLALVDMPMDQDQVAPSTGLTVLESVGMGAVLRAKDAVDSREKTFTDLEDEEHKAQAAEDAATARKIRLTNALDALDQRIDKQTARMAVNAAKAEENGDTANDLILKAREHEHAAKSDTRHAQTVKRRNAREAVSLARFEAHARKLGAQAQTELADASRRSAKAEELQKIAHKYRDEADQLKETIRDVLRSKASSLSSAIDASNRAALRATEQAKNDAKKYARLLAKQHAHEDQATLAQKRADQAALDADAADKEASRLTAKVSAELITAEQSKHKLARLLSEAANPTGATTLRTAAPHPLTAKDVPLGPASSSAQGTQHHHVSRVSKEMRDAADKIRAVERAMAKAKKDAQKRAQEQLEKAAADHRRRQAAHTSTQDESPMSHRPASRMYEDNFEAAMNYLNNRHLDGANGLDDRGRDAVGRQVEGRRAFVGVFGRTPQLDAMATANLRQYQEDETELSHANYDERQPRTDRNPF